MSWKILLLTSVILAGFSEKICAQPVQLQNPDGSSTPLQGDGHGRLLTTQTGGTSGSTLTYVTPDSYSVATTSSVLFTALTYTQVIQLCTLPTSTSNVWLNLHNSPAVVGSGVPIFAGGGCVFFGPNGLAIPATAVRAITDSGSAQTITAAGG